MVKQLAEWEVLKPHSVKDVYDVYSELSEEVHVASDTTDLGRRLLREKDIFEIQVMPEELNKYLKLLHRTMDVSIVVELNILSDWVKQSKNRLELAERLEALKDLGLNKAHTRLSELLKG